MENRMEKAMSFNPCTQTPMDPGEEIVISGISGRFPESKNMKILQENLFNKIDLVTDDDRRWKDDDPEIPHRTGKIDGIEKFDALFFGVHTKQAHAMDPMCRLLTEHAYEAIVDAGVNPRKIRGSKTGVFIGSCWMESEKTLFYEKHLINGFGIIGCNRAMLANRLSYCLGIIGPSYTIDSACSSSLYAMDHAYRAIRSGQCDAALVGAANLCLHPHISLQFSRLGALAHDGRCKSFDADANGYTRSEAACIVYLQKSKDAKRIYATVVHGKTNCDGFKEQGITFPSTDIQSTLFRDLYNECKVSPKSVGYIETHGTGTKVGDPVEVNAIESIFCPGRTEPLKIGSIKSNMGHAEPASGMCSIAKLVIAIESGKIPPNLHYKRPRQGIKALEEGRISVVTEPQPWNGGYAAISSFGFGGSNAHILFKTHEKEKINGGAPKDDLPRLVLASGRTREAVDSILVDVEGRSVDAEYIKLLHDIHCEDTPGHLYRGYTILGGSATHEKRIREIEHYPGTKRPIWFVFSGMGSQWATMGTALLRFPVFAEAIRKCDAVLRPKNVDIYDILTNPNKSTFDNILNSFVGIAAVQIGLVDLLTLLGIVPDNIIGHSLGELGCAYADGCFTAEQMILAAYLRGIVSIETELIHGTMAAVGLGSKETKSLCPPDIEVACHNGPDTCTISGPTNSIKDFIVKLTDQKIFVKEVSCGNIAYHSRYIAKAGPRLLKDLKQVIPKPKARSIKWLSTSVPINQWSTPAALFSSAEYHTNNVLNEVLFEETSALIPKDAITIEIAPHGLLQAILRRSLDPSVTNIALTQKGHKDNAEVFLQGIGKLYDVGLQPQIANLYPEIEFPVSRGTPMISPLIKWEHSDDWFVSSYKMDGKTTSGERIVKISLSDENYEYMSGHVVDGRTLLPATGYLVFIWETLSMMRGEHYSNVSVVFEDVKLLRVTTLPKEGSVEITLMIQKGTGRFEVVESDVAVVTGQVRYSSHPSADKMNPTILNDEVEEMTTTDVYKELRPRGYHYSGIFRGIKRMSISGMKGAISWDNNWTTFLDNMLQMSILGIDSRGLFVPTGIQKLVIDPKMHLDKIQTMPVEKREFQVLHDQNLDLIISGGVEIRGLTIIEIARRKNIAEPVLECCKFVVHQDNEKMLLKDAVRVAMNLASENILDFEVKIIESLDTNEYVQMENLISTLILEAFNEIPSIKVDIGIITEKDSYDENTLPQSITIIEPKKLTFDTNANILAGKNLLSSKKTFSQLISAVKNYGFVLTLEPQTTVPPSQPVQLSMSNHNLQIVFQKNVGNETIFLLRKINEVSNNSVIVRVNNDNFSWLEDLKAALQNELNPMTRNNSRILLISEKDCDSGIIGLVKTLRKEPGGEMVRGFLLLDQNAPAFDLKNPYYKAQLDLDLAQNVLQQNSKGSKNSKPIWGSYQQFKLPAPPLTKKNHVWANQMVRGDLSSFQWLEGPISRDGINPDLVRVVFSSLNFKDIMLATGKLASEAIGKSRIDSECVLGFEYCGIDMKNDRVMGLVPSKGLTNLLVIDRNLSWKVPQSWTMEDAATVPCVYATSYYALYLNGKMKKGDKILIHSGSGGVGQAAINLALHEGCEVFTTVGTPDKRRFIREKFPQIQDDHIGNSRDTSFEQMVLTLTNGKGVDIVLNSLAEEKLQASIRCLAVGGSFLEIGKFDMVNDSRIGMSAFLKEISFYGVLLDNVFNAPPEYKIQLQKLLQSGLDNGVVKPLTRTVFRKDQLEAAFRYMAAGKHIGKVIINVLDEKNLEKIAIPAISRYYCLPDRSYLILGGLGGFGLELADWLVLRGARNLVLTSRSGFKNGYQRKRVRLWESYGVKVLIISGKEASNHQDCLDILRETAKIGPVDAIFNLALVLKDSLWENQTSETFKELFKVKAWSTKNLDELSRRECPLLRHFVVFSSVVCGRGNAGQTNYAMSNSVMERICERRVSEGLPALAVEWGVVGDVGIVAEMQEGRERTVVSGTSEQKVSSCLHELDGFMMQSQPVVSSIVIAEKLTSTPTALNIVDTISSIIGLKDLKTISHHTSLAELGMDSMIAVEIRQTLEREFGIFLTPQDIRGLNFQKLMEMSSTIPSEG